MTKEREVFHLHTKMSNLWKVSELRQKLLFTVLILLLFRLGCAIPVPFIQNDVISGIFNSGNLFSYMNMLSGGALSQCAVFALGVSPYINASIVVQLLTVVFPRLERMRKDDNEKYQMQLHRRAFSWNLWSVSMSRKKSSKTRCRPKKK